MIHATVNKISSVPGSKRKIDVQFIGKDKVLFRTENEDLRNMVINRRYWHILDVPLVLNEWSPETAASPLDLTAMHLWVDLKAVPSHLFSQVGLKTLASPVGRFVKLHPQTERCTRLELARVLIEVNLHKPLVETIKFEDKNGEKIKVGVVYLCLPARCSRCFKWGHKTLECQSKDVVLNDQDLTMDVKEPGENGGGNALEVVGNLII